MTKINIAIDGYSGCGKSTTAKIVASKLGYIYIDTGAMYRATTLYFLRKNVDCDDLASIYEALDNINISFEKNDDGGNETFLNGVNVEKEIRGMEVSSNVSKVSALKPVRDKLVAWQRSIGDKKGVEMDGRDIGTDVFPGAELKLFMTADVGIRSKRRQIELERSGKKLSLEQIKDNLLNRDRMDTLREESPLRRASDAVEIDTSYLTFEEQVRKVVDLAKEIIYAN